METDSDLLLTPIRTRTLYCPTCAQTMNVEIGPDILLPRCRKCQTALLQPPQDLPKPADSTVMYLLRDALPPEVQEAAARPAARFGKFILASEIGRGGSGAVYKAWDAFNGHFVALKRLSGTDEARVRELLNGARSAVRLHHPNIATVFDAGRVGREYFVSMELLDGRPLSRDLREARERGQVPPVRRSVRYLRDVARALHYAHNRPEPIIHCDIKPSNIFIDKSERAFILDFGLARCLGPAGRNDADVISGTPAYMAPEQALGRTGEIDARTDVYGVGAVLYELLAGRPPFSGPLPFILDDVAAKAPPKPAGADPVVQAICLRCLEKDRSRRYATAADLADALDAALQAAPPPAPPAAPPPVRSRKPVLLAIAAAAAAVLLAAGLAFVLLGGSSAAVRAERLAAEFRPDLARIACTDALASARDPQEEQRLRRLIEEFTYTVQARAALIQAIKESRPALPKLRLRDREVTGGEIYAEPAGLVVFRGGKAEDVPWGRVAPDQILDLADRCLRFPAPEDTLGLALFARRSGLVERARSLREKLKGTGLDPIAARHLD